jgi:hypothetical protein
MTQGLFVFQGRATMGGVMKHTPQNTTAQNTSNAGQDAFFADPVDPIKEGQERGFEVIRHLLIWISDAPTVHKIGIRAMVALYCLRPDLVNGITLQQIGEQAGCTLQAVHKIAKDFRVTMGLADQ